MLTGFHQEMMGCNILVTQMELHLIYLAKIMQQDPTYLGFCGASFIGSIGVWLGQWGLEMSIFWDHPCPIDITNVLIYEVDPGGTIANSDLVISNIVLHEATLIK